MYDVSEVGLTAIFQIFIIIIATFFIIIFFFEMGHGTV
jgi:hypothetical protein